MLRLLKKSNNKGFTIIEIMIVLAIIAFIMLALFLAVPALNRSKNNTARKSDAATLASAITEYVNNNSGLLPTGTTFNNVTSLWKPGYYVATNVTYTSSTVAQAIPDPGSLDKISVGNYSACSGNVGVTLGASARGVVIVYDVEIGGGGTSPQCISAQ